MLSPSGESPFAAEEDPIVKAAKAAAAAAKGKTPTPAARQAILSTTPLQAPPHHITDSPPHRTLQPAPAPGRSPLPTADDLLEAASDGDDAAVAIEPTSAAAAGAAVVAPRVAGGVGGGGGGSLAPLTAADVCMPAIKARNKYKVVFLGDESTGKTSIITRFMYDSFDQHYKVTIGIDFVSRTMQVKDRAVRLQLWDTAGQERFRSLIPSYIRDATVAVLVYDISSPQSFASCAHWLTDVHKDRAPSDILVMLAGNKSDLAHDGKRAVPAAEARQWARESGLLWCEVSAKTGEGVKAMMARLVGCLPAEGEREERVEGFGSESKGGAGGAVSSGGGGTVDVKLTGQPNQLASSGGCYC